MVLLTGGAGLLKSFSKGQTVDPGFDPHGFPAVRFIGPLPTYLDGDQAETEFSWNCFR